MEENKLYKVIDIYTNELKGYNFVYQGMFGINISFRFREENICHLIYGTVSGKNIRDAYKYKGVVGYELIVNGVIDSPPHQIRKDSNSKIDAFQYLPKLLESPEIYFFNNKIVDNNKIKGLSHSKIDGDFLLVKEIDGKQVHLFLTWSDKYNELVPQSLLKNSKDGYTKNQIKLKDIEKVELPLKILSEELT